MKTEQKSSIYIRFPLGLKLAIIMGAIVLCSLGAVTFLNTYFETKDVRITAESNNLLINTRSANIAEEVLNDIRSSSTELLELLGAISGGQRSPLYRQATDLFFLHNADIASFYLFSNTQNPMGNAKIALVNETFMTQEEVPETAETDFFLDNSEALERALNGETVLLNSSPYFSVPMISLVFPYSTENTNFACAVSFSAQKLLNLLATNTENTTCLINDSDELLVHPDLIRVLACENLHTHPLVQELRGENASSIRTRQIQYRARNAQTGRTESYFGAYQKLGIGDAVVVTVVPLSFVLEGVYATMKNNLFLTATVLFITILLVVCYTRFFISRNLRQLSRAVEEIRKGNFNTKLISELNTQRTDEIGLLNRSTKDEQDFLNTFAKFTNQSVAKAIATKSIDFEPHLKDCTIFFSDIRNFTAISNEFKTRFGPKSAAEIIAFLNDYMGRMVNCVNLSSGNIDKFEGDAIMGVWGLMRRGELKYESMRDGDAQKEALRLSHQAHVREDAVNCIRCALAMRYALMEYNRDAKRFNSEHPQKYKPLIRIGCGINTGRVTAGVMGGEEKMEYTAIGDAVNFASRAESTTKPCGTDILISEDTYAVLKATHIKSEENNFSIPADFCKDEIVVEKIPVTISVKGKGDQHFYGVVNMPQFDVEAFFKKGNAAFTPDADCLRAVGKTGPSSLAELRTLLNIPTPDFSKVNLNEEENKTVIK